MVPEADWCDQLVDGSDKETLWMHKHTELKAAVAKNGTHSRFRMHQEAQSASMTTERCLVGEEHGFGGDGCTRDGHGDN